MLFKNFKLLLFDSGDCLPINKKNQRNLKKDKIKFERIQFLFFFLEI